MISSAWASTLPSAAGGVIAGSLVWLQAVLDFGDRNACVLAIYDTISSSTRVARVCTIPEVGRVSLFFSGCCTKPGPGGPTKMRGDYLERLVRLYFCRAISQLRYISRSPPLLTFSLLRGPRSAALGYCLSCRSEISSWRFERPCCYSSPGVVRKGRVAVRSYAASYAPSLYITFRMPTDAIGQANGREGGPRWEIGSMCSTGVWYLTHSSTLAPPCCLWSKILENTKSNKKAAYVRMTRPMLVVPSSESCTRRGDSLPRMNGNAQLGHDRIKHGIASSWKCFYLILWGRLLAVAVGGARGFCGSRGLQWATILAFNVNSARQERERHTCSRQALSDPPSVHGMKGVRSKTTLWTFSAVLLLHWLPDAI